MLHCDRSGRAFQATIRDHSSFLEFAVTCRQSLELCIIGDMHMARTQHLQRISSIELASMWSLRTDTLELFGIFISHKLNYHLHLTTSQFKS